MKSWVDRLAWRELLLVSTLASAALVVQAQAAPPHPDGLVEETVCPLVENAAHANRISVALLTRLIWFESRFRADVTSPQGAQGIAQFMPATAAAYGLADPYDPEQAIPKAARLLVELTRQFGNIGLAAAAYNAGSSRVSAWLAGAGRLPAQTRAYVVLLTGASAENWRLGDVPAEVEDGSGTKETCAAVTAALRADDGASGSPPPAPWGVQLAGNFSKAIALASFARAAQRYRAVLGDARPMIVGRVLRSRGTRRFYRVMLPADSRAAADRTCRAIRTVGGACVVVRA